jgi:hypothetical protein
MRGTIAGMAGSDDDIERLLAEMDALTKQADQALSGKAPTGDGTQVARRPGAQPVPVPRGQAGKEGLSPALLRALVVSGVGTGLVWVVFLLVPFIGLGLWDVVAVFAASLLVAAFYTLRGRG